MMTDNSVLETFLQFVRNLPSFPRNMRSKHLALLIVLTLAAVLLSVSTTLKYLHGNQWEQTTTLVKGFQTYIQSISEQGAFSLSNETIRIEAKDNASAKALVFSAVQDFTWRFSAFPLIASNQSYPIAFTIEWGQKNISVWAETGKSWYYSTNINDSLEQKKVPIEGSITLGSQYEVEIDWSRDVESRTIVTQIILNNQDWHKNLTFEFPVSFLPPACALQAWAGDDSDVLVDYNQSTFMVRDKRYTTETETAVTASIATSLTLVSITTFSLIYRSSEFFRFSSSCLTKTLLSIHKGLQKKRQSFQSYIRTNRSFIYLLIVFAAIRLVLALFTPGHEFDMLAFRAWVHIIQDKGVLMIYPLSAIMPPVIIRPVYPYPPIIAYIFSAIVQTFSLNALSDTVVTFLLKLPPIMADLALGCITFTAIKRWKGYKAGLAASVLSMSNVVTSSIWGQYDSLVALFMILAALFVVEREQIELGWLFAALAVCTKETALPFIPALLLVSIRQRKWFSTLLGLGVFSFAIVAVWTPFLLQGYSLDFALWQSGLGLVSNTGAFSPASSEMTSTTVSAMNIWILIGLLKDGIPPKTSYVGAVRDNQPNQFLFLNYFQLGIILFSIFYLIVLYSFRKASSSQSLMLRFGLLMLIFYMFPTRMHERYLHLALPFLVLAYKEAKLATVSYILLLITFSVNLLTALSLQWIPPDFANFFGFIPYAGDFALVCLVVINVMVTLLIILKNIRR